MSAQSPIVLIVEDEELLLKAITSKLEIEKITAIPCISGAKAIEYLESKEPLPDAVWLDYYLKDMNGLAFMKKLKEKKEWADIPVIVVSNSASPVSVNTMLELGAKHYLLKAEHRLEDIIKTLKSTITKENP